MNTAFPFSRPLYLMPKPAGAHCNLACDYCYYLEKLNLYPKGVQHVMTDELTEVYIREYIQSQYTTEVNFTWHGGEPLMRPLEYYRKVVKWQREYAGGRTVVNCLQTNGTLLTPEWCRFLHDEGWLVGISIDGPEHMHDAYRRRRGGQPTWTKVMEGIRLLNKYDVEWNAMAVVNDITAASPLEFYHFFRDRMGCRYLQFTPVVERIRRHEDGRHLAHLLDAQDCPMAPFSVTPDTWGKFLNTIFDEWVRNDIGEMFIQIFDATLANWMGVTPSLCSLSNWCGHAAVMEYNGDVYCCDHFVFPEYKLGNIHNRSILDMMDSERQQTFAKMKTEGLARKCKQCEWKFTCYGECPRNRFVRKEDGEAGINYLCPGYVAFFTHVAPYMDMMKAKLDAGLPPADIMKDLG
ncbi:MAG: anaerobic sulfatase-maturation protein [Bacteroidaceae bacterium]|nr:anaerobic sulfatase-maturation protein [Bacteroidaceae bacterium]